MRHNNFKDFLYKLGWEGKLIILICVGGFIITSIQAGQITFFFFEDYIQYFVFIGKYISGGATFFFGLTFLGFFLLSSWYYTILTIAIIVFLFRLIRN